MAESQNTEYNMFYFVQVKFILLALHLHFKEMTLFDRDITVTSEQRRRWKKKKAGPISDGTGNSQQPPEVVRRGFSSCLSAHQNSDSMANGICQRFSP